ncbi:MAG: dihydropteroate synthase, partial [Phycisphaerales bacterium]|nr:dihydropteroate synthase [Phycisphaerales bacterium]
SVDTRKPEVMRAVLALGVDLINDVSGLRSADAISALRDYDARVIVMFSLDPSGRAKRAGHATVDDIVGFLEERLAAIDAAGVARERIILDPGMGFFVGAEADASFAALRGIPAFKALGQPVCLSVSRKSFLGDALGRADARWAGADFAPPRPATQRGDATLAAECWAALSGVDYIRTHNVRALRDALVTLSRIRSSE